MSYLDDMKKKSAAPLSDASKSAIEDKLSRITEPKSHLSRQILQQEENKKAIEDATKTLVDENEKLRKNAVLDLPVGSIIVVPGRKRTLTDEQYSELLINLKNNRLVTPVTVMLREDGDYELVSGHNRLAVFIELGRPTIPAVVQEFNSGKVRSAAFYANLLHPSLSDYEKYIGLSAERDEFGLSIRDLAEVVGIAKSSIERLMSFSCLPVDSQELLAKNPHALGATSANSIKKAINAGATNVAVFNALSRLVKGEIEMSRAVVEIMKSRGKTDTAVTDQVKAAPHVDIKIPITFGGKKVCQVASTATGINIRISSPGLIKDPATLHQAIADLILNTIKNDSQKE